MTSNSKVVNLGSEGAPFLAYLSLPARRDKRPAILVAHELFAVSPDIRGVVDHLAELGYLSIAPELYHRDAPPGLWLQRDDAGRKRGFELLHALRRETVLADIRQAMEYAIALPESDGRVGMLGFSMGGHVAYLAATELDLKATAVLYGGWLTSTEIPLSQPEPTLAWTPGIARHDGHLLYIVGGKDKLIDHRQVEAITAALEQAGARHRVVVYPDAEHAFFWEGTPAFHRASRDEAWRELSEFFATTLCV